MKTEEITGSITKLPVQEDANAQEATLKDRQQDPVNWQWKRQPEGLQAVPLEHYDDEISKLMAEIKRLEPDSNTRKIVSILLDWFSSLIEPGEKGEKDDA